MALAKGVRPDPVIANPRSDAALIFVTLHPELTAEQLKEWLQHVSVMVKDLTALHRGEKNASVAVGFGPSFFTSSGGARFGIAPDRVPAGFADLPALPLGDGTASRDVVFYVMATHEESVATFLHQLAGARSAITQISIERGFQRADRRELGGFRDGLRNVPTEQRHKTIFVDRTRLPEEPPWTEDGTYMAYLKVRHNLETWEALSPAQQEQIMGRRIKDGSRLDQPEGTSAHIEPPFAGDVPNLDSHVRKAGPRGSEHQEKVQIFRRGVPYLTLNADGTLDAGLHFVSFQASLAAFDVVLNRWMLNPNFPQTGTQQDRLLRDGLTEMVRGGVYFVPPHDPEFIGAGLFKDPRADPGPRRQGTLAIRKRILDAGGIPVPAELGGFGFQVFDAASQQAVSEIFHTDSKGHAESPPVETGKQLTVREVEPRGMQPETPEQQVTIEHRRQPPLRFVNRVSAPVPGYNA
jgi:deferrochelatase/peroxidase EfeB